MIVFNIVPYATRNDIPQHQQLKLVAILKGLIKITAYYLGVPNPGSYPGYPVCLTLFIFGFVVRKIVSLAKAMLITKLFGHCGKIGFSLVILNLPSEHLSGS